MDDDLSSHPSLNAWLQSLQRLAAWMVRGNRYQDPPRPDAPTRVEHPNRISQPSRRPIPPRP